MAHTRRRRRPTARDWTSKAEASEQCVDYTVRDPLGKTIGRVEKLFMNPDREPEYVRVKMGFFGFKSVLIPVGFVEIDEERRSVMLK